MDKIERLSFADKMKLIGERDKTYLEGYLDRAVKEQIWKKSKSNKQPKQPA